MESNRVHVQPRTNRDGHHRGFAVSIFVLGLLSFAMVCECAAQRRIEVRSDRGPARQMATPETKTIGPALRIMGTASVDAAGRVHVGKTPVLFTQGTGVFPSPSGHTGKSFDTRRLNGREVTVYGKRTAKGLSATLVIVTGGDSIERATQVKTGLRIEGAADPRSYEIPAETGHDVGELKESAPR